MHHNKDGSQSVLSHQNLHYALRIVDLLTPCLAGQYGLVAKLVNALGSNPSGLRPCRFELCQVHQNPDTFDIACDLLSPDCRGITVKQGRYLQCRPNNVQYLVFYGLKMCVRYKILSIKLIF